MVLIPHENMKEEMGKKRGQRKGKFLGIIFIIHMSRLLLKCIESEWLKVKFKKNHIFTKR